MLRTGSLSDLSNQIKSAFNGGEWDGNGITSSAPLRMRHTRRRWDMRRLRACWAFGLKHRTFDGQIVDASSLIAKYTWTGDSNLDGSVTTADFTALSAGFGGSGKVWQNGDYNYDGTMNALDFNALAAHFGATPPPVPALGTLVPEPGMIGVIFASLIGISVRRAPDAPSESSSDKRRRKMQLSNWQRFVAGMACAILGLSSVRAATVYTYSFDNGQLTGSASPGTALMSGSRPGRNGGAG